MGFGGFVGSVLIVINGRPCARSTWVFADNPVSSCERCGNAGHIEVAARCRYEASGLSRVAARNKVVDGPPRIPAVGTLADEPVINVVPLARRCPSSNDVKVAQRIGTDAVCVCLKSG